MKLSLYSGSQQKDHIDEGVERVLAKAGWEQSFADEFTRLALGFGGVGVALYVWYLEKTVPFRDSRFLVGVLCAVYFAFTWGSWVYQRYVEKNATYIGHKGGAKVWIATKNPKHTGIYEVKTYTRPASGKRVVESSHTFHIKDIVDTMGVVHEEKLNKVLELISTKTE